MMTRGFQLARPGISKRRGRFVCVHTTAVASIALFLAGLSAAFAVNAPASQSHATPLGGTGRALATDGAIGPGSPIRLAASVGCPIGQSGAPPNCVTTATNPPRPGGYFKLLPVGSFSSLPTDAKAAQMVHYSTWEPRPQNSTADKAIPPSSFKTAGYSGMENHAAVFGRVDGNFTGTTDEIIQWAAAKWGLPDDVMRAQAIVETGWYQDNKDAQGHPIPGEGYGDFGGCGGSPPPSGYGVNGPSSFGIMQDRWCAIKDPSAPGYDGWPWSENSTAYNLDVYGAVMRGCYEGWDTWLGGKYKAGNLWGCVGKWFSGTWFTGGAKSYIADVKAVDQSKSWRGWPSST